jgi:flagellar basal-body rod protein FlgG
MNRALSIAASGMQAQQLNVDVISNNIANLNTTGFKRGRADFQDLIYQTLRPAGVSAAEGSQTPTGIEVGLGTMPVSTQKIFLQGSLEQTENTLDMAIEGDGFFQVLLPNGDKAYTRDGSFTVDKDGNVVNAQGYPLEPAITVPTDSLSVSVSPDGTVSVMQVGQVEASEIGSIELARFVNSAGLSSRGRNLFLETDASGSPTTAAPGEEGLGTIAQGYLEMSNVSVVDEMVKMIAAQRAYETNSKAVKAADEMLEVANNLKR